MRLRLILITLSLLAVVSASTGGYLYYATVRNAALKEAERQAAVRLGLIAKNISFYLTENIEVVRALAGMDELLEMLVRPGAQAQRKANAILDLFKASLGADVCYLMNYKGNTIASSNRNAPDSFVGKNFEFRPYFQEAFHKAPATYLALGVTSGKRGVYYSYPIFEKGEDLPIGVAVIKGSIERIEKELSLLPGEIVLVSDPRGVVFISSIKEWRYQLVTDVSEKDRLDIAGSRQFGNGPWEWIGLQRKGKHLVADRDGTLYRLHEENIDPEHYPGWKVMHLRSLKAISQSISNPLARPVILALCILVGLSVFFLYSKASREITRRKAFEKALSESEKRYRSLYHNTPAMLHSIDPSGRLLSVSDYWVEALGYARSEIIGKNLLDFLSEESRRYARNVVFPAFFQSGVCKDIPYQFVTKSGEKIDVLLSAIADRDADGNIVRTLAVSIDVTERKRAEEALRLAKEELSRYSKDLERQVEIRTREITSILKYTPAVVYIKDIEGRYLLVNSRYEQLFGVKNETVRGLTDFEIFPRDVADRFREQDLAALKKNRSHETEERIPQNGDIHTYLSVKFPVYDETGNPRGVCGIATDITQVKKVQHQLRRLSGSIMTNQEKERSAIARELHDELGQVLTALRMEAVWLQERLREIDTKGAERARSMCSLIDKTIDDARSLAFRLRPGVLDDLGLVDALELYTTDFEKRTGITCLFDHHQVPATDDTVATAAYRIAQEALTNVARHAHAGHVKVQLSGKNTTLTLTVTDDGRGFNAETLGESEGLGLAGMRERAMLAGGMLDIRSETGKGTSICFQVRQKEIAVASSKEAVA
jgi:PAS domain S-box-containing protein